MLQYSTLALLLLCLGGTLPGPYLPQGYVGGGGLGEVYIGGASNSYGGGGGGGYKAADPSDSSPPPPTPSWGDILRALPYFDYLD